MKTADWIGCCAEVADLLLRQEALVGLNTGGLILAASALQRYSGWYHAGVPLWSAFREGAQKIGDMIFPEGFFRYLKIGEEWTNEHNRIDLSLADPSGRMSLQDFARGAPNEIRHEKKRPDETRHLASRILNFVCENRHRLVPVEITTDDHASIIQRFPGNDPNSLPLDEGERRKHPLLNWSVDSNFVDELFGPAIKVRAVELQDWLRDNGFNPDKTYNPPGDDRLEWFMNLSFIGRA